MRIETIDKLCCPFDKSELQLRTITREADTVLEGLLTCNHCHRIYPIVYGIPIMSPDEYRDFRLEKPLLERFARQLLEAGKEE